MNSVSPLDKRLVKQRSKLLDCLIMALSSEDRKLFKMLKAKKKGSEGLNKEEKKQLKALKLQKAAGDEKKEAAQAELNVL